MPLVACPHCGETIDTWPDPGAGDDHQYIEDCSICCRAITFHAVYSPRLGDYFVEASAET